MRAAGDDGLGRTANLLALLRRPYYKQGPPRRKALAGGDVSGRRLVIAGRVLSTACRPLARARVDFWQADGNGEYDNQGYRLRGYQRSDGDGRYRVETVVPGSTKGARDTST
jgi:protocatechuate 3,4-dioxygenase beta subunit